MLGLAMLPKLEFFYGRPLHFCTGVILSIEAATAPATLVFLEKTTAPTKAQPPSFNDTAYKFHHVVETSIDKIFSNTFGVALHREFRVSLCHDFMDGTAVENVFVLSI